MRKTVLIAAVSAALVFAEDADSLRAEIERMTARLQEIERKDTSINEIKILKYSSDKKDVSVEMTSDDTAISIVRVETAKKDGGSDASVRTVVWGEIKKSGGWNERNSIGISGGVGVGATVLDMRPAKKFLTNLENASDSPLKNSGVSASLGRWGTAVSNGGFGFGSFGNGVIAGGGGYRVRTDFVSNTLDTAFITFVNLRYGGFALGNGWQNEKNSFSLISFIGGGSYDIDVKKKKRGNIFSDPKTSGGGAWTLEPIIHDASSSFFALDLQANYVRSFMRWFHVGGEISGLFAVSRTGFDYTYGYFSFSPSVRINFLFGWI